jgi:hypothetical protein
MDFAKPCLIPAQHQTLVVLAAQRHQGVMAFQRFFGLHWEQFIKDAGTRVT